MKDESLFSQGGGSSGGAEVRSPGAVEVHRGPAAMSPGGAGGSSAALDIPPDLTPSALIYVAIKQGMNPDALGKLAEIQERFEKREAEKAFVEAFAEFRKKCPAIKKNRTANIKTESGTSYSFKYAERDEIAKIVDPILEDLGFTYTWNTTATKDFVTAECVLSHKGGHSKSSSFTVPTESRAGMSPQQKFSSAASFAQRLSFVNVLGLTTTEKDFDESALDPTKINEDQETEISELVRTNCDDDAKARFLAFMGVDKVADIRAADYAKAVRSLKKFGENKTKKGRASE